MAIPTAAYQSNQIPDESFHMPGLTLLLPEKKIDLEIRQNFTAIAEMFSACKEKHRINECFKYLIIY